MKKLFSSWLSSAMTGSAWKAFGALRTFAILGIVTMLNALLLSRPDMLRSVTEMYILAVLLVSVSTSGYLWGIVASIASVLCINYFFTAPMLGFNFTSKGYPVTFLILLAISIMTSALGGRLRLRHELARQREELAAEQQRILHENEREKTRGNLLRAISHDLRTPLTGILGAAAALLENGDYIERAQSDALLRGIHDDAEWLLRMVENVLSVTRISGGKPDLKTTAEPLDELFSMAADKVRKRFPDLILTMDLPPAVTFVRADQVLIVQLLVNLIDNAVRHGGGRHVWLTAADIGSEIRILVRDNGKGFPPQSLDRIFEGFAARDGMFNDSTRGLGIGLSICRTIVECHGGQISAQNPADGGASVQFTLPKEEITYYGEL